MTNAGELTNAVSDVLKALKKSAEELCIEPSVFSTAFSRAQDLCSRDTENLRLSTLFLTVLCRAQSLYGSLAESLSASKEITQDIPDTPLYRYFCRCFRLAADTSELFQKLFSPLADTDFYVSERNLVFSECESLLFSAKELRLYIRNGQRKIFRVLPKLELVYTCEKTTLKCMDLCRSFDAVNNKFTLFT